MVSRLQKMRLKLIFRPNKFYLFPSTSPKHYEVIINFVAEIKVILRPTTLVRLLFRNNRRKKQNRQHATPITRGRLCIGGGQNAKDAGES